MYEAVVYVQCCACAEYTAPVNVRSPSKGRGRALSLKSFLSHFISSYVRKIQGRPKNTFKFVDFFISWIFHVWMENFHPNVFFFLGRGFFLTVGFLDFSFFGNCAGEYLIFVNLFFLNPNFFSWKFLALDFFWRNFRL